MFKYNLSLHFLLPLLDIKTKGVNFACEELLDSYLTPTEFGGTMEIVFKLGVPDPIRTAMVESASFITSFVEDDQEIFEFELPHAPSIIKPFLQGKFSEMDKSYIHKHFGPTSMVRKVVEKDLGLKRYWEDRIGSSIGDQEVWTIPKREQRPVSV